MVAEVACRLPRLTSLQLHGLIAKGDAGLAPLSVLSGLRRLAFTHQGAVLGALGDVLPSLTFLQVMGGDRWNGLRWAVSACSPACVRAYLTCA